MQIHMIGAEIQNTDRSFVGYHTRCNRAFPELSDSLTYEVTNESERVTCPACLESLKKSELRKQTIDVSPTGVWFVYSGVDEAMFISDEEIEALRFLAANVHFNPDIIFWPHGKSWELMKEDMRNKSAGT